jgi:hypothetical protein
VQRAPESARAAARAPSDVQSGLKIVRDLHGPGVTLHFCGGLRFDEGHIIAK